MLYSEMNVPAMRIGPGKHLKGRKLMGGVTTPEQFDHFHEVSAYSHVPVSTPAQCPDIPLPCSSSLTLKSDASAREGM